jgi:VWFA-related protein
MREPLQPTSPAQPRRTATRPLAVLGILGILVGLALCGLPASGQSPGVPEEPAAEEEFFGVVDVEVVNIDVWVTDPQGNPVEGLGKDDFVVLRDGAAVEITNFYAVADGRPATPVPAENGGVPEPLEAPAALPEPTEPPPPEHRLWLVVYIDNYNLDPVERKRVIPALHRFLSTTLGPGDRAMIVSATRSAEVRLPFTEHLPSLFGVLDEIADESGYAVVRRRELMETLSLIDKSDTPSEALFPARRYAEQVMNEIGYTVDALERLVESLAGLPGRKALVHVSSGMPMVAGEPAFVAVARKYETSEAYGEIPRFDTSRSFEKVSRQANAHRVVFYTLDAGGQRGMEFGNAEYGGFISMELRSTLDSVVPESLQAPLRLMALETGGRAIVNRNDALPALEEAAQDFRSFYSLGIASGGVDSDRYHRIEVRLRDGAARKGLSLRHRAGYRSKNADTRVREGLRSALLYDHQSNPLGLEVGLGTAERDPETGSYLLPVVLRLPLRDLVLLPTRGGKHELRLMLYVGAMSEDGGRSEIEAIPLGLRIGEEHVEAALRESFVHTHRIRVRQGRQKVGIAVSDVFGRQTSIVTRGVHLE